MTGKGDHIEPSWLNSLLLTAAFLTLGLVLTVAYKGWKGDRALHHSERGAHTPLIADITVNLGGIPHQEHCLTCHPQGRAATLWGRAGKIRNHPPIAPHAVDDLGCTGCHLGEGMARDPVLSHGVPGWEARKVLAGPDVQASCYRCHHLKPLPGAENAWEGYQLFLTNACDTCHTVEGAGGGRYGPDLSQVGSFLGLKEIQTAIEDPRSDPENSIMPKFSLSPEQIKSLSYFLKSRVRNPFYETPMIRAAKMKARIRAQEKGSEALPSSARDLLRQKKCLACHKYEDEDGQIAPDLTYLGYMRSKDYVRGFLRNPGQKIPGAVMPWITISGEAEERILSSLAQRDPVAHFHGTKPKHLYMTFCQRCHAAQGDGFGTIQPNLANFPRAFWKNAEFFRRIPDERIVRSIEQGIPGTSMPPYGELLGRAGVDSLVDLIFREFIRTKRADKRSGLAVPTRPAKILTPEKTGKVFAKKCSSCHGISGNGKGEEYLKYVPRPRDLTNRPYLGSLSDERIALAISHGIPGTAMQGFSGKLSPQAIWSLVNKIREISGTKGLLLQHSKTKPNSLLSKETVS